VVRSRHAYACGAMRARYVLILAADLVIVFASFVLLSPAQICAGDPPTCSPHPYFGFLRLVFLLLGVVVFLVVLALSSTDHSTRKPLFRPDRQKEVKA
jgi:hypothetical protein